MKCLPVALAMMLFLPIAVCAEPDRSYRVEGHGFSASTLRPLPGVAVELWSFYQATPDIFRARSIATDEGGFYRFEEQYASIDEDGNDRASGYAFALICTYKGINKVQIMPLYSSLKPGVVYHRNFYMQVPESVTHCGND